jgi:hypothetical protein
VSLRLLRDQLAAHDTLAAGPVKRERRANAISDFAREQRRAAQLRKQRLKANREALAREAVLERQLVRTEKRALQASDAKSIAAARTFTADTLKQTPEELARERRLRKKQKSKRKRFGADFDDEDTDKVVADVDERAPMESGFKDARAQLRNADDDDDDDDADPRKK